MKRITKLSSMLLLLLMTAWTQMFAAGGTEPPFNKTQALKASEIAAGKEIALWVVNKLNNWYTGIQNTRSATLTDAVTFIVEDAGDGNIYLKRKSDSKYMKYIASGQSASWVETSADATAFVAKRPGNVEGGDEKYFNYDYNTDGNLSTPPSWDPNYEYLVRFAVASTAESSSPMFFNGNTAFGTGTGNWSAFLVRDVNVVVPPFTLSDAPKDGQFAANTQWYYLKLNDKYATCREGNNYISLSTKNPISYGSFWAFVQNTNGNIEIYNAYTGTSKVLASVQPTTDNCTQTQPSLVNKNELGDKIAEWEYSKDGDAFFLNLTQNSSCVLNDADNKGIMAFWKEKGDGSKLKVEPVDVESVITFVKESQKSISGAVGTLLTESYNKFNTALEKNTMEGLVEALTIKDLTGDTIPLISTQYYRLQNVYRTTDNGNTGKYMLGATANGLTSEQMDLTNASLLWKIEKTNEENESTVKLYHANAQKMSGAIPTTIGGKGVALSDDGAEYTMTKLGTGQYGFKIGSNYMVQFADNQIGSWNQASSGSDHAWYIMPATSINVTISAAEYATVNYPFAIQLPAGLTAYTGQPNAEKSKFILKKVPDGAVPANTPVVIAGPQGTYPLTIDYENAEEPIESGLTGVLLPTEIRPEDYILANGGNGIGFYTTTLGGTLAQNKAYIESNSTLLGVRGFGFTTEDDNDTTTGIESTITESENEEYYDLQGRRVMNPTKGIYVTKSGKKVLFTK